MRRLVVWVWLKITTCLKIRLSTDGAYCTRSHGSTVRRQGVEGISINILKYRTYTKSTRRPFNRRTVSVLTLKSLASHENVTDNDSSASSNARTKHRSEGRGLGLGRNTHKCANISNRDTITKLDVNG